MKVIFTSNRFVDFIIRLLITAIVISPVIIWSWDTVKETTALLLLSLFFTPVCSCLFCIFVFLP
nr:IncF plasmid conjugative transfer protein TrbE [Escherichia coli]BBC45529.1 IncF plasmid conjugative transfer protein TrbE [Escherichia coli]